MKAKIVGNNGSHLIVDIIKVDGDLYYFDGFPSAIHKDDILEIYNDETMNQNRFEILCYERNEERKRKKKREYKKKMLKEKKEKYGNK